MLKTAEVFVVLSLIVMAGLFAYKSGMLQSLISSPPPKVEQSLTKEPAGTLCTDGINSNSGDNFCSNYHGSVSICRPGFPGTYPDSCTQSSQTHF